MCVCVCVCLRGRQRDTAQTKKKQRKSTCGHASAHLCICAVCVFVLPENLIERLVFIPRHLRTMLLSEIMNRSHRQNSILLIIRQHTIIIMLGSVNSLASWTWACPGTQTDLLQCRNQPQTERERD